MKILFVCAGNTCRSPIAAAILKKRLNEFGIEGIEVASAGVACRDEKINPYAVAALNVNGIATCADARARQCDKKAYDGADMIVAMERAQADSLNADMKGEKAIAFKDVCGYDIPDPYGGGLAEYERVFALINAACLALLDRIKGGKS